jgi:hypothetical protein
VAIPSLVVQAGAGGAMLTITLLRSTVLTLHGGHVFVLHDPLGLTGDRLLAHLHRALAGQPAPPAATCPWVTVRAPLSQLWEEANRLPERVRWRTPRRAGVEPWPVASAPRASRVAEPVPTPGWSGGAAAADDGPVALGPAASHTPHVLLLSESDRPDALAPVAAARLVLRAARQGWASFAVTRQGAAGVRGEPWRTHLVCRRGALQPVEMRALH